MNTPNETKPLNLSESLNKLWAQINETEAAIHKHLGTEDREVQLAFEPLYKMYAELTRQSRVKRKENSLTTNETQAKPTEGQPDKLYAPEEKGIYISIGTQALCRIPMRSPNAEENADLIHESFAVYHETGLTPRELVGVVRKLYDLAEKMGMIMTSDQWTEKFRQEFNPIMQQAENIIEATTE